MSHLIGIVFKTKDHCKIKHMSEGKVWHQRVTLCINPSGRSFPNHKQSIHLDAWLRHKSYRSDLDYLKSQSEVSYVTIIIIQTIGLFNSLFAITHLNAVLQKNRSILRYWVKSLISFLTSNLLESLKKYGENLGHCKWGFMRNSLGEHRRSECWLRYGENKALMMKSQI